MAGGPHTLGRSALLYQVTSNCFAFNILTAFVSAVVPNGSLFFGLLCMTQSQNSTGYESCHMIHMMEKCFLFFRGLIDLACKS